MRQTTIRLPDETWERVETERQRREDAARAVAPTATIPASDWIRHLIEDGLALALASGTPAAEIHYEARYTPGIVAEVYVPERVSRETAARAVVAGLLADAVGVARG